MDNDDDDNEKDNCGDGGSGGDNYDVRIVLPPSWKWVFSKRKEFAPNAGANFFPFRVEPFSEGVQSLYVKT